MTAPVGVPRAARVALVVSGTALVTACATASGAGDQAQTDLAKQVAQAHERALSERTADPTAVDAEAAYRLGYAVTGGNATSIVSTTATPDGVEAVTTSGVRTEAGGGLSYAQTSLGACLRTRATPGSATGDAGERGTVSTEAVPCPDGVVPVVESAPVEATTIELTGLRSPVPRPSTAPCLSGSGDCVGG